MTFYQIITVFLVGASPLAELRGAIPLAIGVYGFSWPQALAIAWLGNLIPAVILLWSLGPISDHLMKRSLFARKFFEWLFARTRRKFSNHYEVRGEFALVFFVAIPFFLTGVWTGSIAAFLFGIPQKRALFLISLGALLAGFLVTALTMGTLESILWLK